MRRGSANRGYTLVETVVVVAVIGIVVLPILSLFISGLTSTRDSRLLLTASYIAQDKVEEVFAALPSTRIAMTTPRQIVITDTRFEFSRVVTEDGAYTGLVRVVVEVFWQDTRGERTYKVVTLLAPIA